MIIIFPNFDTFISHNLLINSYLISILIDLIISLSLTYYSFYINLLGKFLPFLHYIHLHIEVQFNPN